MLSLDDVLSPAPEVISRESGDEFVLVLPERGRFLVLNRIGADVFALLDGWRNLGDVARILSERYSAPLPQAQADVLKLAAKLLDRGAVRLAGEG